MEMENEVLCGHLLPWASGGGQGGIFTLDFGNILLNVLSILVFNNKWL